MDDRRSSSGALGEVVRPEDHVDVSGPLLDLLLVHLGQAAPDRDLHVRTALPEGLEIAKVAVELVVGVLPDAAGVEHHHVGRLHVLGRYQAIGHQGSGQPLGVVLVHLAPECADVECPRRSDLARPASSGPLAPVGSSVDAHPDKDTAPGHTPTRAGSTGSYRVPPTESSLSQAGIFGAFRARRVSVPSRAQMRRFGGSGSDFAEEPAARVQSRPRRQRVVPACPPGPLLRCVEEELSIDGVTDLTLE